MGNLQIAGVSSGRRVGLWVAAHEELTELARRRSELDGVEGPALLRALRAGVHRHLGLGSFAEYVERLFGYSRRTLDDKLRTAEALEELPELTRSLREGVASWSAVRELARVATPETEREWLDATRGRTVHEVERLVSGRRRGARPGDEAEASEQRHTLRFEVRAETFATFREAVRALRRRSNGPLDDDSALLLMAREVLGGTGDEGKSSYQVALNICERCGGGSQNALGEVVPVDDSVVQMAHCDAQYVGRINTQQPTHVGGARGASAQHVFASDAADDVRRAPDVADVPGFAARVTAGGSRLAARETSRRARDARNKSHVGEAKRATQTIPPALRRKVMRRDHGRCVVPGCRHATFVDVHHIETRTDGGVHHEDNLIVLCSAHHRALHNGQLELRGSVIQGLVFRRSDGRRYGELDRPHSADTCERAFRGLRGMGFGEREARRAIEEVRSSGNTEMLLRRALALLTDSLVFRER